MTHLLNRSELEQLDKPALLDLILQLAARIEQLEGSSRPPPTTSQNSSQPPSQDQKPSQRTPRGKAKHGPPHGHTGHTHPWVESPDHHVMCPVPPCGGCGAALSHLPATVLRRHQVMELPPTVVHVIEVHCPGVTCPQCGTTTIATPPPGLEADRVYGSRLHAMVAYLKHHQHLSYARLDQVLQDVFGLSISQGAIDQILRRMGSAAHPAAAAIQAQVVAAPVIHSDETGSRLDGEKAWHWVFLTPHAVLHHLNRSRGGTVPQTIMGDHRAEVWVCDCWAGQLQAPAATIQLCLSHQVRNLQAVIDLQVDESIWAAQMQAIFYNVMRLAHPSHRATIPPAIFQAEHRDLERQLAILLAETVPKGAARTLQRRYQKHRDHLFVCLTRPDVPATNNVAERAVRPSVIHRKVTNGFRSQWGADAYMAILSVTDTARIQGQSPMQALLHVLEPPALPLTPPE